MIYLYVVIISYFAFLRRLLQLHLCISLSLTVIAIRILSLNFFSPGHHLFADRYINYTLVEELQKLKYHLRGMILTNRKNLLNHIKIIAARDHYNIVNIIIKILKFIHGIQ
ncbi:piggyBac transposable element-derived protein 4-like [Vespula maculifrons]|uniref:PiggyBac transposable element-derived protein 4-like n=1 Tax=Vespula maculifrons TaxID=7453 RepID=A0ABD2B9Q9_VESMC